jgi:hypothetical protein
MTKPEGKTHGVGVESTGGDVGAKKVRVGVGIVPHGVGDGTWVAQAVNPMSAAIRDSRKKRRDPDIFKNPLCKILTLTQHKALSPTFRGFGGNKICAGV